MKPHLAFHFAIGFALVVLGLVAGARPHAILDVVLTNEELQNLEVKNATLDLLLRGAGSDSWCMVIIGIVLMASSLFANRRAMQTIKMNEM